MNEISSLFINLINLLNTHSIEYFLIRNFKEYPERFTGDIDIYIDLDKFYQHCHIFENYIRKNNFTVFKKLKRKWICSYQLINNNHNNFERNIIVIELFNGFSWILFPYITFDRIAKYKTTYNGYAVVPDNPGYILTFCHYFYWAGFLPDKYLLQITKAFQDPEAFNIINNIFNKIHKQGWFC